MRRASGKGSGGVRGGGGGCGVWGVGLRQGKKRCLCVCGMRETALYSLITNLAFQVAELMPLQVT